MTYTRLFYVSIDDGHNVPCIYGPWTEATFRQNAGPTWSDGEWTDFLLELEDLGFAYTAGGDRAELHTAESQEAEAADCLERARKMRAGEEIP